MGLGVFEQIPVEGSISLAELSKATGVQDSLLGSSRSVSPSLSRR